LIRPPARLRRWKEQRSKIMSIEPVTNIEGRVIQDPPLARFLFSDKRMALVWLVVRVLVGWQWLTSGWGKIQNPAWMETGDALRSFWEGAVAVPEQGRPEIAVGWYRDFIQGMLDAGSYVWFAKLVALGETLVGLMLILGLFVGIAAFISAFMSWNFVMAGSASTNAMMGLGAILLILAWKTAGYYGLDYFVLPRLGTPWQPVDPAKAKRDPQPPRPRSVQQGV
jgi:thiosulfate dehydrogenase (quinone) large subunit